MQYDNTNERKPFAQSYPRFNKSKDTILYVDLVQIHDSIPDSLYKYPIRSISIKECSLKYRKNFLKQLEHIGILDTYLYDSLILDSTFTNLQSVSIYNARSVITNKKIKLRDFTYSWDETKEYFPFSFVLEDLFVYNHLHIRASEEYIEIPIDKNYKSILYCTKNKQYDKLKKYYPKVDTLICKW